MRNKGIDWCQSSFANVLWIILPAALACGLNQGHQRSQLPSQGLNLPCQQLHASLFTVGRGWSGVSKCQERTLILSKVNFMVAQWGCWGWVVQHRHRITELIRLEKIISEIIKPSLLTNQDSFDWVPHSVLAQTPPEMVIAPPSWAVYSNV